MKSCETCMYREFRACGSDNFCGICEDQDQHKVGELQIPIGYGYEVGCAPEQNAIEYTHSIDSNYIPTWVEEPPF